MPTSVELDGYATHLCLLTSSMAIEYVKDDDEFLALPWLYLELVKQYLDDRGSLVPYRAFLLEQIEVTKTLLRQHKYFRFTYVYGRTFAAMGALKRPWERTRSGFVSTAPSSSTTQSPDYTSSHSASSQASSSALAMHHRH